MLLSHERRVQAWALLGTLPALTLCVVLLQRCGWNPWIRWILLIAAFGILGFALVRQKRLVERPLQTLSNLIAALKSGDFSFRARERGGDDALESVFQEINALSELLQQQRLKAFEATALLRAVMSEIDVAVFAFDAEGILRLVNRAGENLISQPQERILGMASGELGLASALEGESPRLLDLALPGRSGRFELRRTPFRQGGIPHHLLVLSDLTRPLREEERQAWQRIIRVLGHEINNSLAPIQSLSGSITSIIDKQDSDWREDARQGLDIIASRAQSLGRFMEAYTRLAKLPEPRMRQVDVGPLAHKVAGLEQRRMVQVLEGPPVQIEADGDQLEQALINLVRNGVEAGQIVTLTWCALAGWLEFSVEDDGPGLPTGGNLFVPFFTTKPGGNGIGLLLARQIAEGHGGNLLLANKGDRGARATLRIPRKAST